MSTNMSINEKDIWINWFLLYTINTNAKQDEKTG